MLIHGAEDFSYGLDHGAHRFYTHIGIRSIHYQYKKKKSVAKTLVKISINQLIKKKNIRLMSATELRLSLICQFIRYLF